MWTVLRPCLGVRGEGTGSYRGLGSHLPGHTGRRGPWRGLALTSLEEDARIHPGARRTEHPWRPGQPVHGAATALLPRWPQPGLPQSCCLSISTCHRPTRVREGTRPPPRAGGSVCLAEASGDDAWILLLIQRKCLQMAYGEPPTPASACRSTAILSSSIIDVPALSQRQPASPARVPGSSKALAEGVSLPEPPAGRRRDGLPHLGGVQADEQGVLVTWSWIWIQPPHPLAVWSWEAAAPLWVSLRQWVSCGVCGGP